MNLIEVLAWASAATLQPASAEAAPDDQIMGFRESDAEMNKAKAEGIASVPDFLKHFDKPMAKEAEFMVKYDVDPTDGVEYVWATISGRSDVSLDGILINQPVNTQDKLGDRVTIRQSDVIDWAYRRDGIMQGSFTTRVMLSRMPESEAAEYRAFLGW